MGNLSFELRFKQIQPKDSNTMTTEAKDEVREATERVRTARRNGLRTVYGASRPHQRYAEDQQKIINAYLEEHPDDDDQKIIDLKES